MVRVRELRLRTGATQWGLFRNGERPGEFEEIFVVASWDEHLRQHRERMTATDLAYEEQAKSALRDDPANLAPAHRPTSTSVRPWTENPERAGGPGASARARPGQVEQRSG